MSRKEREKIDKRLVYVEEQMELFLWKNYRYKVKFHVQVSKMLTKKGKYSETTFPSDINRSIEVEFEYGLMAKGSKQKMLETAFKEATRIGCYRLGKQYRDGRVEFDKELRRHGLPVYGGVSEMGKMLHGYECSKCSKVWALKVKKLSKTKDPEQLGYRTVCCKELFRYSGVKHYDNETLQKIKRNRQK